MFTDWSALIKVVNMKTEEEIEILQVIRHPDYDSATLKNDICLIKEQFNWNFS